VAIRQNYRKRERGQVLIMCALFLVLFLLMVGLAIDFGMAYVARANLGKAVDAAALTGAKNLQLGQAQATALAQSAFAMNYGTSGTNAAAPVVNISYSTDASGNKLVNINASATIGTAFIGLLPGFGTVNVASGAQAVDARVVMTLVLDRTGSMTGDGGSAALPPSVTEFINLFDNTNDTVEELSFAENVTVDVPMRTGNFQQPIINAVDGMPFLGGTWSEGGMQQALADETSGIAVQGTNVNVLHVVVFFTDGNANTVQSSILCSGGVGSGTYNLGGYDTGSTIGFFVPNTNPSKPPCSESGSSCCPGTSPNGTFNSHVAGALEPITWTNISGPNGDGRYRVVQLANLMRAQNIVVYAVGLGSASEAVDPGFLCQVANDPVGHGESSSGTSVNCAPYYNNNSLPAGFMAWAQTADQLDAAFQEVAADIKLRLTQ
jgi:Flp pilus assembly protein TadG